MNRNTWVAVGAALFLTACGGGSNDGGYAHVTPAAQPPASSAATPANATPSSPRKVIFEALGDTGTFRLDEANAAGANGWRYVGPIALTTVNGIQSTNLYAKDADTTYAYEDTPLP